MGRSLKDALGKILDITKLSNVIQKNNSGKNKSIEKAPFFKGLFSKTESANYADLTDDIDFASVMETDKNVTKFSADNKSRYVPSEKALTNKKEQEQKQVVKKSIVVKKDTACSSLTPPVKVSEKSISTNPPKKSLPIVTSVIPSKTEKVEKPKPKKVVGNPVGIQAKVNDFQIIVDGPVSFNPNLLAIKDNFPPITVQKSLEQIVRFEGDSQREVNIGLDFGTSSVKVVVGDREIGKAFAVPFFDGVGIETYLHPSRVWLGRRGYSLFKDAEKDKVFRDLKINLTGKSCAKEYIYAVTAYIALILRRVKAWLLTEHKDIYKNTFILWKLTLGLPATDYENKGLVALYKKIGLASWYLSINSTEFILKEDVINICDRFDKKTLQDLEELEEFEIAIVPELSAQVYGFLESTRFDPNARNYYMLVDVGAGTVDATVFYVKRERGKKYNFGFFANSVEPNGVANLHQHRIDWFSKEAKDKSELKELQKSIKGISLSTDFMRSIPENINEYFEGVSVKINVPEKSPDSVFYREHYLHQVLSKTFEKSLDWYPRDHAIGMPLFICGGGSRMTFYNKLKSSLASAPNVSEISFRYQQLTVPSVLQAPGITEENFDRLSVAFGLSYIQGLGVTPLTEYRPELVVCKTQRPKKCPGCGATYGKGTCSCG